MPGSEESLPAPAGAGPRIRTVAFGTPFLPALARHCLDTHGTGLGLARLRILLPSARARRGLVEAFLAATGGRALLLPRIAAIGEIDAGETLDRLLEEGAEPLRPAVSPLARRLALAQHLAGEAGSAPAADRLARDLARVLDLLAAHGVTAQQLAELEAEGLAAHRARRLVVLEAIVHHWPGALEDRGLLDPVARRETLLAGLAERWTRAPPGPVVAAGFAAAPPAVARLLRAIARLPEGEVILPGLDPHVSPEDWAAIGAAPTHPLHGLYALLDAMGVQPAEAAWLGPEAGDRARALLAAFRPASGALPAARGDPPPGLALLEARGPEEEALAIALALRRALETQGQTAALVTRSRALARRVAAALRRWGLAIDDSAGEPLALRPPGAFLLALLDASAERFRPVPLLAALKHPLAGATSPEARAAWLAGARALDLALRGPAPAPGLAGIAARLAGGRGSAARDFWAGQAAPRLAPLEALFEAGKPSLAELVRVLADVAAALAGDRLWSGPDGRALGELVAAVAESPDAAALEVGPEEAPALVRALLDDVAVRPPWRQHPRLAILGPLEARLAHADLLILGDLNEGSWPALPQPDPWLPPAVRRRLGLAAPEARVGLEAHDLLSAVAAPALLLTRARRDAAGPTVRSRFLLRLEAAFGPLPRDFELEAALALDGVGRTIRLPRPCPAPPAAERPRLLRVTEADMLAADPFAFYARRMLGLEELKPLEQEADAAVKGTVVHRILERLVREAPADPDALVAEELATLGGDPALLALWGPRVRRMVAWVRARLAAEREAGWQRFEAEVKLAADWGGIRIEGKADRIDIHGDGRLRIVDYKTGKPPTRKAFEDRMARQLPLLRLLVEAGGSREIHGEVGLLEYWKLSGGQEEGTVVGTKWTIERATFAQDLRQLFARFLLGDEAFVPKLVPVFAEQYRTYDQLARVEEWL
ncbi:double-strand break repair protein AddB [Thermaurantiacus tibetensis]|uniref:double-strand break repair protein AddB n=1 Tax=Thermaurantiacus tibetensis TaxID=2759035 RepID=UPI0018908E5E|nr:double-strand break repair protein AddB [Thermaurantiacus tibetensis]